MKEPAPRASLQSRRGPIRLRTGNTCVQIYQNKLQFRDGKLISMREFWDPKRIVDALNGTFDGNIN